MRRLMAVVAVWMVAVVGLGVAAAAPVGAQVVGPNGYELRLPNGVHLCLVTGSQAGSSGARIASVTTICNFHSPTQQWYADRGDQSGNISNGYGCLSPGDYDGYMLVGECTSSVGGGTWARTAVGGWRSVTRGGCLTGRFADGRGYLSLTPCANSYLQRWYPTGP